MSEDKIWFTFDHYNKSCEIIDNLSFTDNGPWFHTGPGEAVRKTVIHGILTPNQKMEPLVILCQELTQGYDSSHDLTHHQKVLFSALTILYPLLRDQNDSVKTETLHDLVTVSAMLHDTIDDKYCTVDEKAQKQQILKSWLEINYPSQIENILWIIDNVSFSKEKKRGYPAVHDQEIVTQALRIVSDADKLEALGIEGVQRMMDYNMNQNLGSSIARTTGNVPVGKTSVEEMVKRIKEHTAEKLSLLKDHYIHTKKGKELAKDLHNQLIWLVDNDQRLTDFVKRDSRFQ